MQKVNCIMDENKNKTPDPKQDVNNEEKGKISKDAKTPDAQPLNLVESASTPKTKKPFPMFAIFGIVVLVVVAVAIIFGYLNGNLFNSHIHSFGEWSTTKNATCTEDGTMTRYCDCGEKQNETIPANGHKFGNWKEAAPATCLSEGKELRTCVQCAEYESRVIAKSDAHTPAKDEGILPTCSTEGLSEGFHCSICEKILEAQIVLPKSEHKLSTVVMEEEYCGEAQVSSVYCGDCGDYVVSYGHHYMKSVTEATCTEEGEIRYTCDICGDSYFNIIPANGHIETNYEIVSTATCKNNGIAEKKCMICDKILDTLSLDKKSHSYSVSVYDGIFITYKCGECGDSYSVENETEVFNVIFKSDNVLIETISVASGEKIEYFPEVEKAGYRLSHWMINDGSEAIYDSGCIYEDTELIAVWEEELVLNTKESDIAVFSGVETNFAFTVVADNMSYVTDNLFIYNIDDEKIPYQVMFVEDGIYEVTSGYYQPGKFYYAVAQNNVAFVGTESKEIQFSIAGENNVNIEVGSSVKWLEYSDVYGMLDSDEGKILLTNCSFNVGDSVAIYEDNK